MENLYIEVVDGVIKNHPIFESNLLEVFPEIDLAKQDKYIPFQRILQPTLGIFEVNDGVTYEFDGPNLVKDVWHIRDMTSDEKQAKIALARSMQPYPSWTFDETNLLWSPPTPYPSNAQLENKIYHWDEDSLSWKEVIKDA
jgi:hypothetical protein